MAEQEPQVEPVAEEEPVRSVRARGVAFGKRAVKGVARRVLAPLPIEVHRRRPPEPEPEPEPVPPPFDIDAQAPLEPGGVDVAELLRTLSIDELSASADEYYRQNLEAADYYVAKPFWSTSEVADTVTSFGQVLGSLALAEGMRVLDFGAGTGWTSRYLSQLGCEVVVSDVSPTALELAEQLYEKLPVVGWRPAPTFTRYDGRRIDLPDESVDRILCFDALHHTPNPDEVIAEMGRVLRPGGRAVFSEPGPNHSKGAQSQFEMKNYTVIENDIRMRDIERWALASGFDEVRLSIFTTEPFQVSIEGYERFVDGGAEASAFLVHHRPFLEGRRIFALHRAGEERRDSRSRDGLGGTLSVTLDPLEPGATQLTGAYEAENIGVNHWLASTAPIGPVSIGVHRYDGSGRLVDRDHARIGLDEPDGVAPGATTAGTFRLPLPEPGDHLLEFDLLAEGVAWFEINGTVPVRLAVSIPPTDG